MSITYSIEICNEKIEDFSVFIEEIFKAVLECGKKIVKDRLEDLDEELMPSSELLNTAVGYILILSQRNTFFFLIRWLHRRLSDFVTM